MISPLIYEAAVMWTGTYLVFFLIMAALCISNLYMVPSLTLPIFITQCWQETTGREWETTSYWRHGVAPSTRHLLFCTCALSGWPFARNIRPTSRYGGQTYKRLVLSSEETWNTRERESMRASRLQVGWRPFPSWFFSFFSIPFLYILWTNAATGGTNQSGTDPSGVKCWLEWPWDWFQRCCTKLLNFEVNSRLWEFLKCETNFSAAHTTTEGTFQRKCRCQKVHSCWDITCTCQEKLMQ